MFEEFGIAIANHMERVLREQGKTNYADRFKGFRSDDGGRRVHGRLSQLRRDNQDENLASRSVVWNGPATDSI